MTESYYGRLARLYRIVADEAEPFDPAGIGSLWLRQAADEVAPTRARTTTLRPWSSCMPGFPSATHAVRAAARGARERLPVVRRRRRARVRVRHRRLRHRPARPAEEEKEGSEEAVRALALGRPLAAPGLPEAVVRRDDQPVRYAGVRARVAVRGDRGPRRERVRGRCARDRRVPAVPALHAARRRVGRPPAPSHDPDRCRLRTSGAPLVGPDRVRVRRVDAPAPLRRRVPGRDLTVFFDVAYQSYLPSLVEREQIIEGNSKLEVSRTIAQISGAGVAGGSSALSQHRTRCSSTRSAPRGPGEAFSLTGNRKHEEKPAVPEGAKPRMRTELWEGLQQRRPAPAAATMVICTVLPTSSRT